MTGPSAGGAPAISLRGISKRFGKVVALDAVDLEVPAGTLVGVAGPHGAGKSTLVHVLAGLARPSAGSIEVGGRAGRRGIGLVLEGAPAFDWMTVREALVFAANLAGVPGDEVAGRVEATLARVALDGIADERIGGHGSEIRRWLSVGQALVGGPEVLLVDEAPATFEPAGRRRLRALLDELRGATTVLLTTRHLADVEGLCDRLVLLGGGRVLAEGPTAELVGRIAAAAYVVEVERGAAAALEGLAARFLGEPWVADAVVVGPTLRIVVSEEARAGELLQSIAATGIAISAFRRERPPLDDVVVALEGARP